ncbi:MAG TPA: exopolysaccharide biosynthesis polyprenyl glycosylphosphotransferase [Cyclobacteriaceae bacterium]
MSSLARIWFFLGDLIFLNLSIFFSFSLHSGAAEGGEGDKVYLFIFSNLAWLFLVMVSSPYNVTKGWSVSKIIKSQFAFVFIHLLVVASLIFFFKKHYSLIQISLIYILFVPIFFSWKIITYYLRKVLTAETLNKNFILIGRNPVSDQIRKYYLINPQLGYRFQGYYDFRENDSFINEIRAFCVEKEVHEIYCCAPTASDSELNQLINFGLDSLIKIKIIVDSELSQESIQLERFDKQPGLDIAVVPLDETRNQLIKRIFDLVFSFLFLVTIMSWLLPIIALIIKLDSKGPVFFIQLRSGKNNKSFNCFKFRTMKVNVDSDNLQATKDDPRITKWGAFLRKTSIDELPQFINVFVGNMSVIGPRPHMLKHTEEYSKLIDKFMGRHYVKPGITGLAQCLGYRGETKDIVDMENRVRMDRYYIENWTFWLDIKIIFLTIISLIRGSDKAF